MNVNIWLNKSLKNLKMLLHVMSYFLLFDFVSEDVDLKHACGKQMWQSGPFLGY